MKLKIKKDELKSGTIVHLRKDDEPRWMVIKGTENGDVLANAHADGISLEFYNEDLKFLGKYAKTKHHISEELVPYGNSESNDYDIIGIYENYFRTDGGDLIPLWREGIDYPKLTTFQKEYLQKIYERTSYRYICVICGELIYFSNSSFDSYESFEIELQRKNPIDLTRADKFFTAEFGDILRDEEIYSIRELIINGGGK